MLALLSINLWGGKVALMYKRGFLWQPIANNVSCWTNLITFSRRDIVPPCVHSLLIYNIWLFISWYFSAISARSIRSQAERIYCVMDCSEMFCQNLQWIKSCVLCVQTQFIWHCLLNMGNFKGLACHFLWVTKCCMCIWKMLFTCMPLMQT